jgi:putative membrane protein
MHNYYWGPFGGLLGAFLMLIPILLLGAILIALYKLFQGSNRNIDSKSESLEILNKRYANGEISEEEYTKKKKDILS